MDYYDDFQFLFYGENPKYRSTIGKRTFSYFALQYNHSGNVIYNGKRYSGSCYFFTYPGSEFEYGAPPGEERYHTFLCFNGSRVQQMLTNGLLQLTQHPVKINNPERMLLQIQNIIKYLSTPGYLHHAKAINLFEALLLFLHEDFNSCGSVSPKTAGEFQKLVNKIRLKPEFEWNFQNIAAELAMSESHFRFCFRQYTGYAPNQFVIECRLNLAVALLRHKRMSISEIANRCGFNDSAYFSRLFKKHRGVSPQHYFNETY